MVGNIFVRLREVKKREVLIDMEVKHRPLIYNFLDIVQYLDEYFKWRKHQNEKFTYSEWCKELNLGNKTTLRFLLQRKRPISKATAKAFKAHLQLEHQEEYYFDYLLMYSQPKSEAERSAAGAKLIEIQRGLFKSDEFDADQLCKDALGPIVLTMIMFKDFEATEENIAHLLKVDALQIRNILKVYLELKVVKLNDAGIYYIESSSLKVSDKPNAEALKKFHQYWLTKSQEALQLDYKLRRFRALNFALTTDEFNDFVERINDFAISVLSKFNNSSLDGRRMYMLETAFFPTTEVFNKNLHQVATDIELE